MTIFNKINWVFTWLALSIAKKSLRKRIEGEGAYFLQPLLTGTSGIYNRIDFITAFCKDKRILHVGFTDHPFTTERIKDGSLLHLHLQAEVSALMGVDIEQDALGNYFAATGDTHAFWADITQAYPPQAMAFKPDIILLTEVLEHLKDPYTAIDILFNSFENGTTVLVTVPNYTSLDSISASLNKTESVHPHHYWYFSPYTLVKLFDEKRFTPEQIHFGMYYQPGQKVNAVMRNIPYNGDCIIALFSINKI